MASIRVLMSTSEPKEEETTKEARLLSPSAYASVVIYNKITVTVNFGSKEPKPHTKKT